MTTCPKCGHTWSKTYWLFNAVVGTQYQCNSCNHVWYWLNGLWLVILNEYLKQMGPRIKPKAKTESFAQYHARREWERKNDPNYKRPY